MTVVVQLRGGLGNQLFQYAAGFSLSERRAEDLVLDTALLPPATVDRGGVRRWPEQISLFAHAGTLRDTAPSPFRKRLAQSFAGRERAVGDSQLRAILGRRLYARETREDVAAFNRLPEGSRINAYCNSWRFFEPHLADVANQVRSLRAPGVWFQGMRSEMDAERPIAVHVRWGDYLNLRHVYGVIGADYYRRAIDRIVTVSGTRPIWLFSDDPDGAGELLAPHVTMDRVVRPDPASSALENLLLLSRSAGIVAANSSFSWWAAFLSSAPAGAIVFPRPLFAQGGPPEPKEWLLPDWMQIGRD